MRPADPWTLEARDDLWLSRHIGRPALLLQIGRGADDRALRQRLAAEPVFATAKVPAENVAALRFLEEAGCRVVDVNMTYGIGVEDLKRKDAGAARLARPEDRAGVEDVAGHAFRFTRFHLDNVIPLALAHRIKRIWAGNFFAGGRGTALLVAEDERGICGFLQVLERGDAAVIDLVAVVSRAAGRGHASAMIALLAKTPLTNGQLPRRIIVGSQAANIPATRFYENLGFRLEAAAYVLHHHGNRWSYPSD
jgi:ribosomal protein S18 acetylase RimI-like enzyme